MQKIDYYFFLKNEIRFRLRHSTIYWLYLAFITLLGLLNIFFRGPEQVLIIPRVIFNLTNIEEYFSPIPIDYELLIILSLTILSLCFVVNLDTFTRESSNDMSNYLSLHSNYYSKIFSIRILSIGILFLIPIVIMILIPSYPEVPYIELIEIPLSMLKMENIIKSIVAVLFFLFWFEILVSIMLVIDYIFHNSFCRIFLYYPVIFTILGFLLISSNFLSGELIITEILLGRTLEKSPVSSLIIIIPAIIFFTFFIAKIIPKLINELIEWNLKNFEVDEENFNKKVKNNDFISIQEKFSNNLSFTKNSFFYLVINIPFLLLFIYIPSNDQLFALIVLFSIYLSICQLYALFFIFPTITLEKECHMEEMMLTRISYFEYYQPKLKQFVYQTIKPLIIGFGIIITESVFLIINNQLDEALRIISFCFLVLVQLFFFTGLLFVIWRFYPSKNLKGTTILTIFGLDLLLFIITYILRPRESIIPTFIDIVYAQSNMIVISPIISSLSLSFWYTNNDTFMLFFIIFGKFVASLILLIFSFIILKFSVEY